jgi:hypothetical protein
VNDDDVDDKQQKKDREKERESDGCSEKIAGTGKKSANSDFEAGAKTTWH